MILCSSSLKSVVWAIMLAHSPALFSHNLLYGDVDCVVTCWLCTPCPCIKRSSLEHPWQKSLLWRNLAVRTWIGQSVLSCYRWFHDVHQWNISKNCGLVNGSDFGFSNTSFWAFSPFWGFCLGSCLVAPSQFSTCTLWNCMSQQLHCGPDLHEFALWNNILPLNVCFSQHHLAAVRVWNMAHQMEMKWCKSAPVLSTWGCNLWSTSIFF